MPSTQARSYRTTPGMERPGCSRQKFWPRASSSSEHNSPSKRGSSSPTKQLSGARDQENGSMKSRLFAYLALSCLILLPVTTWAQTQLSGSIAGVVKDTSGAVMPGVTVEAASPALIEKVRSVVSDAQGQYKIVDLRPGTYVVTFTLPGFSTVKRDGVELTTGITATVSAELKVGTVEETITVSGAAPVVDTQNVASQNAFTGALL